MSRRYVEQRARQVQRRRQSVAAQARASVPSTGSITGTSSRDWSDVCSSTPSRLQEVAVGRAAAQEDVLAVVDVELAVFERAGERVRGAAESGPRFEQRDRPAGVGSSDGRGLRPASPPPTTTSGRSRFVAISVIVGSVVSCAPRGTPFPMRASESRSRQHAPRVARDALEQAVIDARHRRAAGRASRVEHRQQLQAVGVPLLGARGLLADQRVSCGCRPPSSASMTPSASSRSSTPDRVEFVLRQVDAAVVQVFANVAQDVRQLQRDAQRVGERVGGDRIGCLEDAESKAGRSNPRRSGSSARGRGRSRSSCPRTSSSQPSTSSRNAGSGIGSRDAASASARGPGRRVAADRLDSRRASSSSRSFSAAGRCRRRCRRCAARTRRRRQARRALSGANNLMPYWKFFAASRMMRSHSSYAAAMSDARVGGRRPSCSCHRGPVRRHASAACQGADRLDAASRLRRLWRAPRARRSPRP